MAHYVCKRCDKMVSEDARAVHDELNHPKHHLGNPAALMKARAVRQQRLAAVKTKAAQLEQAWEGVVR